MGGASSSAHNCYEHHELVKNGKADFFCEGCKMIGIGPRYACKLCDETMHKWCRYPKVGEVISHEFYGSAELTFTRRVVTKGTRCNACLKHIRGYNYLCKANGVDLHPGCYKLDRKVYFDGNIFNLQKEMSSCCMKCKSSDIKGWSYVSSCNNDHYHVHCFTEKLHDFYMKMVCILFHVFRLVLFKTQNV